MNVEWIQIANELGGLGVAVCVIYCLFTFLKLAAKGVQYHHSQAQMWRDEIHEARKSSEKRDEQNLKQQQLATEAVKEMADAVRNINRTMKKEKEQQEVDT